MTEYEFDGFLPVPCCGLAECLDAAGIDGRVPRWRPGLGDAAPAAALPSEPA
ncbi:MAG: hypothetical protein ACOH1P_05500 [Lysobacter sp.]